MSPFEKHLRQWATSGSLDSSLDLSPPIDESTAPTDMAEVPSSSDSTRSTLGSEASEKTNHTTDNSRDNIPNQQNAEDEPMTPDGQDDGSGRQWGTPFRVQWIRVRGLPFHSTRMLRNPWNKDREVKVSRDGTELESSVGRALLDLWDYRSPNLDVPGYFPPPHPERPAHHTSDPQVYAMTPSISTYPGPAHHSSYPVPQ